MSPTIATANTTARSLFDEDHMKAVSEHLLAMGLAMLLIWISFSVDREFVALHAGLQLCGFGAFYLLARLSSPFAKSFYAPVISFLIVVAAIHADNFSTYGPLLRETLDAIFQTTRAEATSYLEVFSSPLLIPVVTLCLALAWISLYRCRIENWQPYIPVLFIAVGCALVYLGRSLPVLIYTTAVDYQEKMTAFNASRSEVLDGLSLNARDDVNVVLILGESTARAHLSLYGYPRKTTPYLDSVADELAVYRDVVATHSHTNESLSRALTFNKRDNYASFTELPDLISIANAAGVDTYWFSNQNTIGLWDNVVSVISAQATAAKFHDPASGFTRERGIYDMVLIDSLKELLRDDSNGGKLIVLHTMAPHFPYCNVVPADYRERELEYDDPPLDTRFFGSWISRLSADMNEQQLVTYFSSINCYDRAVNYIDSFTQEVVDYLKEHPVPSAVLYTADHGEAVIYNSGHESRMHSHFHVEVPFVLWRSPHFEAEVHVEPDRKASLEDLAYSVIDLLGVTGLEGTKERSIFSATYFESPRTTLDGRVGYDVFSGEGDHIERARANLYTLTENEYRRVWAHRINSYASMMEARELFAGVEMDLVFEEGEFNVRHPPVPSVGLTLEDQLEQDSGDLHYWFDWKNASIGNIDAAIAKLEAVDRSRDIKERTLVEISAIDGAAGVLSRSGWKTSYYLPTARILDCMASCGEEEAATLAAELWSNFDNAGFGAISFDIRLFGYVEKHMAGRVREEGIPVYSWATGIDMSREKAPDELRRWLRHDWIRVLLVTLPSHFYL